TDIVALGKRLQFIVERNRQPDGMLHGFHDTLPVRVRSALSGKAEIAWFFKSHSAVHSERTLENWRKTGMHPCVRCVSNLLVRYEVSRPFFWLHVTKLTDIGFCLRPTVLAYPVHHLT